MQAGTEGKMSKRAIRIALANRSRLVLTSISAEEPGNPLREAESRWRWYGAPLSAPRVVLTTPMVALGQVATSPNFTYTYNTHMTH